MNQNVLRHTSDASRIIKATANLKNGAVFSAHGVPVLKAFELEFIGPPRVGTVGGDTPKHCHTVMVYIYTVCNYTYLIH